MKKLLIEKLTVINPTQAELVRALSYFYKGNNLVTDFSKILKEIIKEDFYEQIKTNTNGDSIIILSDKYKVTESFVSHCIYR